MDSQRFPSEGGSTWGPSPCDRLSRPPTTMAPLTSCPPFRPPRCYPCRSILPSLEERSGSPTFTELLWLHATLSDHGGVPRSCPVSEQGIGPSRIPTLSASSHLHLTRLNRFNPKVCGLQPPCLRLTHAVTDKSPRLGMEYAGSALSQWHFQPPVVQHFVAHQNTCKKLSLQFGMVVSGTTLGCKGWGLSSISSTY